MTALIPTTHTPALQEGSPLTSPLTFRSSAVARMASMPVSTLRIWEQRYQAVAPTTAPTGQRQYSASDVERVVLLRQLTLHGHAIGSLAALSAEQLSDLARAHAATAPATPAVSTGAPARNAALRLVVVGQALARRLERPAVQSRWPTAPALVAVFDTLAEAAQGGASAHSPPVDVLVWQAPGLQADALPELKAAQQAWRARHVAVAYRFAGATARDALVNGGASVVHEPSDDAALVAWLSSVAPRVADEPPLDPRSLSADAWSLDALRLGAAAAPARRFDDATLTEFAGLASSVACECPSHVAELLMQIASFERYSSGCASRSPADAELHAYLTRVAGAARVMFEAALERVATAEGLALP